MKNVEVSNVIDPIQATDGAGVKLKRSICLLYTSDAADE